MCIGITKTCLRLHKLVADTFRLMVGIRHAFFKDVSFVIEHMYIHLSFEDVSVVCQRAKLEHKTKVPVFASASYDFGQAYESCTTDDGVIAHNQFSD